MLERITPHMQYVCLGVVSYIGTRKALYRVFEHEKLPSSSRPGTTLDTRCRSADVIMQVACLCAAIQKLGVRDWRSKRFCMSSSAD